MKEDTGATKMLCYLGIFVLAIFIILPPLFRFLFEEEETGTVEDVKLVMNLNCVRTEDFGDYKLKTTINTNYIDNKVSSSTFIYEVDLIDSTIMNEEIMVPEYESLKKVSNVDFNEEKNTYTLFIDYSNFDYSNEPLLWNHQKIIAEQIVIYTEDSFECITTKVQ